MKFQRNAALLLLWFGFGPLCAGQSGVPRERFYPTNLAAVESALPRVASRLSLVPSKTEEGRFEFIQPAKLMGLSVSLVQQQESGAAAGPRRDAVSFQYAQKSVTNYLLFLRLDEESNTTRAAVRCRTFQESEANAPWFANLFLSALEQELAGMPARPVPTQPRKSWLAFLALDLLNPGLALGYGYDNPLNRRAPPLATMVGILDLGFVGLTVAQAIDPKAGTAVIGVIGLVALRQLAGFMFGWDVNSWRRVQKSGYRIDASLWDSGAGLRFEKEF